jgi:hypothetical protein
MELTCAVSLFITLYIAFVVYNARHPISGRPFVQSHKKALARWKQISNGKAFEVSNYGELAPIHEHPLSGMLGIHNNDLRFVSASNTLAISLDSIRWISHQNSTMFVLPQKPLTIYCETNDLWSIYAFTSPQAEELARAIQAHSHADYQPEYVIGGPLQTSIQTQDVYGEWAEPDSTVLCLAPDRLLSLWHTWIELKQIRHLGLLPDNTIQISYLSDRMHVVGLILDFNQAMLWQNLLERATGLTVEDLAGRKKKSENH